MQKGRFRQKTGSTGQNPLEDALRHHGNKPLNKRYRQENSKVLLRIKVQTAYS